MQRGLTIFVGFILIGLAIAMPVSAALLAPTELPEAAGLFADPGASVHAATVELAQAGKDYGLDDAADAAGLGEDKFEKSLPKRIGQIIFILLGLIGVIFLILVIYGGFLWMTAGGNAEQVGKGRDHLKNGAIGVIIILTAYAITTFVFDYLITGTTGSGI